MDQTEGLFLSITKASAAPSIAPNRHIHDESESAAG